MPSASQLINYNGALARSRRPGQTNFSRLVGLLQHIHRTYMIAVPEVRMQRDPRRLPHGLDTGHGAAVASKRW